MVAARARERLLHALHGEDAERARHARAQLDVLDPARRLGAHVVVVIRLAADDGAEARDAGDAAGLREVESGERQLVRARHVVDLERRPRLAEGPLRAAEETRGQLLVEPADGDPEVEVSHASPGAPRRARPGPARARRAASPRRARAPGGAACARGACAWRGGNARCAGWARARSGPAPSRTARSPRAR